MCRYNTLCIRHDGEDLDVVGKVDCLQLLALLNRQSGHSVRTRMLVYKQRAAHRHGVLTSVSVVSHHSLPQALISTPEDMFA